MWTTIKSLDPRILLPLLRRRVAIARLRARHAERVEPAVKPESYGAILSYDNVY